MKKDEIHVIKCGGASLIKTRPIYSPDGQYLLCASDNDVKVYSTAGGECVHRLVGHRNSVTGIALHPKITLQVLTCSLDKTICRWDYEDGVLLSVCNLGSEIYCLFTDINYKDHVYFMSKESEKNDYTVQRMLLKTIEHSTTEKSSENICDKTLVVHDVSFPLSKSLGFMSSGQHIVCRRKRALIVVDTKNLHASPTEYADTQDGEITCLACHPKENCCVTGHKSGKIKFWHNVYRLKSSKEKEKQLVVSTQHWHKDPVADVCFTPEGSSLLSVGKEGVLVQWQYAESGNSKNFFPRLGGPIRHIISSCDGTLFATTHVDNCVLIINSYFSIRHTIEGFTASKNVQKSIQCNMQYDRKTNSCVTNGKPGHLLFYKPYVDEQLYNLDVVNQNYVASDLSQSNTVVSHYAFSVSATGSDLPKSHPAYSTWMATVEERDDGVTYKEQKLKFWVFDGTEQWWKLNTVINDPHESTITKIVFRPFSDVGLIHPALLTTGIGGMAKIWTPAKRNGQRPLCWSCEAVATYRNLSVNDGDFSQDGSLAALGFAQTVCLSHSEALENLTVLLTLPSDEKIQGLVFGCEACQHILVLHTVSHLYACNLLDGGLMWSAEVNVVHLIRDPLSEFMAAFTDDNSLHIFKPSTSMPVYTRAKACKRKIVAAQYVPNSGQRSWMSSSPGVSWLERSRIFFVTDKMSVRTVGTSEELKRIIRPSTSDMSSISNKDSLWTPLAYLLSQASSSRSENSGKEGEFSTESLTHTKVEKAVKIITEPQSHVLPPISALCQSFLSTLLLPVKKEERAVHSEEVAMEIDDKSSSSLDVSVHEANETMSRINESSFEFLKDLYKE